MLKTWHALHNDRDILYAHEHNRENASQLGQPSMGTDALSFSPYTSVIENATENVPTHMD